MKPLPKLPHRMTPRSAFRADVASRIGAERDSQGRVWCQLFPLGEWHRSDFPSGKLELTADLFAQFIANWKAGGSPALPVDYNHDEEGPASGWIEDLRIGPSGCLEGATKWNERAAAEIKADEKRYLSPTWAMQHVNRTSGEKGGPWLYGAALLNDPFFDSMPRVAATAIAESTHNPNEEQHMSFMKRIAAAFGLPDTSTEEEITAKCEAMAKSTASASEESGKLTASLTAANDTLAKLTARNAELEAGEKKHAADLFERDFEAIFKAGLDEGREGLPELKETLKATASVPSLGLDAAKKMIAALPKVKLSEKGNAGNDAPAGDLAQFESLIEAKMKASSGLKYTEASKLVAAEQPALAAKVFPSTTSTTPRA